MKVQPRVDNFSQLIDRLLSVHELSDVLEKVGKKVEIIQFSTSCPFFFIVNIKKGWDYHSQS